MCVHSERRGRGVVYIVYIVIGGGGEFVYIVTVGTLQGKHCCYLNTELK